MTRRFRFAAFLFLLPAGAAGQGAPAPAAPLPVDSAVIVGTLPNGLRYYIRANHKPEKRADLRLVVNAGSILETGSQLGLAHVIEHMAFEGTTHFPRNTLVGYLQSIGMQFGADLNASTAFDETIYQLSVPTDTERLVNTAFQILADWAHGVQFDSSRVMAERQVVREEWRGDKGAEDRMMRKWLPIAFKGSRYAQRLPIGTEQSIMTATPSRLRPFYHEWYRPDLMAVVAVGDFDPAAVEALIRRDFGPIPNPAHQTPRPSYGIPANKAPLIAITTDKEATGSDVDVLFKLPHRTVRTVAEYRASLIGDLYLRMLNNRFDEIAQQPSAPFLDAGASRGSFYARTVDAFSLSADVKNGGIERGTAALIEEARRADRFGFLADELARAKANLVRGYQQAYAEREKTNSGAFVEEYVANYLYDDPMPGIAWEYRTVQALVPGITLAEVDSVGRAWATPDNRVVIVEAPDKPGVEVPTAARLTAVMDSAARVTLTPYTETVASGPLLAPIATAGTVTATTTVPAVNVTEWTLSNGARVVVKPTDFRADEILLDGFADGGTSLAPDSTIMSASLAPQIADLSGLGRFSRVDLDKKLAGKVVGLSAGIGETQESLSGHAAPRDLETLFQLIHLEFTGARLDTGAYQAFRNQIEPYLANRGASPDEVFADTIQVTMAQHDVRAQPLTTASFATVNPETAIAFFKRRFAGAAGFTFVFVGNVNLDTLRALSERYLATLPAGEPEHWRLVGKGPPAGVVERVVHMGVEPKATTVLAFTGPAAYTPQNRFDMRALSELLQIELVDTLREELGGTYSPGAGGGMRFAPRQDYTVQMAFESSPDRADTLFATTMRLIEALRSAGPSAADVDKVKAQLLREHQVEVRQNNFWAANIAGRLRTGEDLAGLGDPYYAMIGQLTAAQLQRAANAYLNTKNYARFVLLPGKK
ncbi:MAG: insulinase family protein, partial [Gemmatimonadota bacterium]|nr:insulinase family protein [Gemmatimonadota bacterium]